MFKPWKIGRAAGIDVYLHPSFLLVLAFPQVTEGGALGLALILAAFGCVLLHEFGHALMARRYGIGTVDITLYPIGGVARLERMPRSAGAELLIALAGPAVNFAIVTLLLATFWLWPAGPAARFLTMLVSVNLVLGLFNLIPAFPMDGGRVLRALLSGLVGRLRATFIAATIGRVLALIFGAFCLVNGLWFQVFLAGFIYLAAGMELAAVAADEHRRRLVEGDGIWTAPPGYHWVRSQSGWQLAPIFVNNSQGRVQPWR